MKIMEKKFDLLSTDLYKNLNLKLRQKINYE